MEWRTLDWLPDYQILENGTLRRTRTTCGHPAGEIIKGQVDARGYVRVHVAGQKTIFMHKIVCEAFHGPCPPQKTQVAHGDGVKTNNHYTNLRWATAAENADDKRRHGSLPSGETHHNAKLTWDDVREIRALSARLSLTEIATKFGVHCATVGGIVRGERWREVA